MILQQSGSEVAIGWTDGKRFVAVRPPLNDQELEELKAKDLIRGQIENIDLDPACTQISFSTILDSPESANRRARGLAVAIAEVLRASRSDVSINLEIVSLVGHNSSPFNPNTDVIQA